MAILQQHDPRLVRMEMVSGRGVTEEVQEKAGAQLAMQGAGEHQRSALVGWRDVTSALLISNQLACSKGKIASSLEQRDGFVTDQ